eukprot:Skav213126  [mRNA]  locus=scaffold107:161306:167141:+ [translate_table: standard]
MDGTPLSWAPPLATDLGGGTPQRMGLGAGDTILQTVPLGWIVRLHEWTVADRVQAYFKTGGGKSSVAAPATVMSTSLLEAELYFDDGVHQHVSKAWVTQRIRDWHSQAGLNNCGLRS